MYTSLIKNKIAHKKIVSNEFNKHYVRDQITQ